jgi:pyrophosphatase PpaX
MKKYQYILLDWDGNLAKTLDVWLEATRQVIEKRINIKLSDEEIAAGFGAFEEQMTSLGITDIDEAFDDLDRVAKQLLPNAELYPDTLEVLEYLHNNGKSLALISTALRDNIERQLTKFNMRKLFDSVICGDDVSHLKPHPEPLEKALAALGGVKNQAIMIGDSDKDLGAAANAGIDSILFYPPEHHKYYNFEQLKKLQPTFVVDDFRKIEAIIV